MSIRSRIVLSVTVVFAGISLLAGWLMLDRAEQSLKTAFDRATQTRAEWLLSLISVDPVVLPLPTAREQMQVVYQSYDHEQELFRSPDFPGFPSRSGRPNAPAVSYRTLTVQTSPNQLPEGQVRLMLAVPDSNLRQDIGRLRWVFGVGGLLSLALALVAGYGVAGWLLRPLQTIITQADAISRVATHSRIGLPATHDELYQLSDTLNRMLARIQANDALQQNFFGAAAHELRTPLTVMKTGLDVTLATGNVGADTKAFLVGQRDEVNRLSRLVDEFLTLSRPDEQVQSLKLAPVNVSSLIVDCLHKLATVATDYGVSTQLTTDAGRAESVLTDAVKLEHILMNLIENAIKYAVAGSRVTIDVTAAPPWRIRVQNQTVRESGPTLDLQQPYFRADPLREGHGLGLWISSRFTTLLEGGLLLDWQKNTFICELTLPDAVSRPQP